MTDPPDPDTQRTRPREALFALGPDPDDPRVKRLTHTRDLEPQDQDEIDVASALFSRLTVDVDDG